ncbi:MAG: NAD-dependent epimerase/dehydratase family protein [Gemmatimonadota bacterium]
MGRLALVTGATGFIGRHLVDQLADRGWQIRALVRASSDVRHLEQVGAQLATGDLASADSLARAADGCDTVFHLAAVTAARSEGVYRRANVEGVETLVGAILASSRPPRRLVYLSSYAACGPATPGQLRPREAPPAPLTAYGRTKLAGEGVAKTAIANDVQVLIIRAPAVYGPGDRALLPYFRLVRWGLAPEPGGAERQLHLLFAPDLASALRRAADAPTGTFAVAEPVVHRWSDVVSAMASALGRRPLRFALPAPLLRSAAAATEAIGRFSGRAVPFNREKAEEMLAPAWTCDLSGMKELLPAEQVTPLARGIEQTVRWYIRQGWL